MTFNKTCFSVNPLESIKRSSRNIGKNKQKTYNIVVQLNLIVFLDFNLFIFVKINNFISSLVYENYIKNNLSLLKVSILSEKSITFFGPPSP